VTNMTSVTNVTIVKVVTNVNTEYLGNRL